MSLPTASGERIVGRYALHAAIASGATATIHLGRDPVTARVVAIKRLHPELASDPALVATFLDEARLAARIAHPNVVHTLDAVHAGDEVFLVMEYVPGESLARLVRGKRPPSYRATVAIIRDVLRGLESAHEAGGGSGEPLAIIHRDVSPQNILVGTDGIARLLDFGVAKARGRGQGTDSGEIKGRLAYMAPEILRDGTVSPRTDIYAVGVVLWELVTGKRLFKGESARVAAARVLEGEAPTLMSVILAATARKLPDAALPALERLDGVVMRAVSSDPEERYASAREMAADLALALEPAAPPDIAAWVERTAHDVLASRAEMVAALERGAGEDASGPESEPFTLVNEGADALLPIVVADLADESARRTLIEIAEARGVVLVPLLNAPGDAGDHVLEVHVPEQEKPTLFLARPVGAPEPGGFPLALRPYGAWQPPPPSRSESPTGRVAARSESRRSLTASHTRDLTASGVADVIEPNVLGRTLSVQGGEVVLEERLGGGGGGAVYRGRYTEVERKDVAVKVQHDRVRRDVELCARFHAEALAASKLDHRNLVRVIDFGQEPDGLLHLTMEYLEGRSLREILEEDGPMQMERAVKLLLHVCAGLAHAHRCGVIHRDVKPSNVLLVNQRDDDGRLVKIAKVCDFGIATGPAVDEHGKGDVMGTPQYMSPEQCRGAEVDARSDIYSCGVLLYELVTGKLPFQGRDRGDFIRLHQLAAPTPPSTHMPDIDPLLEQILLKTLEKTPEARYASMLELRSALKELLEPAFFADQRPSAPPLRASGRPSASPASPEADDQPVERSLEALVGLLKSLSEMPHASAERLSELEKKTEKLEGVLRSLAARGDAVALNEVIRVMAAVHEEASRASSAETWTVTATTCAQRVLHTVADPVALVPAAEKLLSASAEPTEAQLSLLVWAKVAGAYALFTARAKLETQVARTRFVSAMRLIGAAAVPVVRGALEQQWPAGSPTIAQPALVVDLLRSIPGTRDDTLGTVISRYARCPEPEIQHAALATLVHVWGDRATPALLAGVQSTDEKVQIIAVRGLRTVAAVDELVVRKIDGMLAGESSVSDDLLVAAAEALGYAASGARPLAARVVLRIVSEGSAGVKNAVAIAFARAALALAPADARKAIEARAARGAEPLRGALLALL